MFIINATGYARRMRPVQDARPITSSLRLTLPKSPDGIRTCVDAACARKPRSAPGRPI